MREFVQAWRDAFRKRRLLIYATAITSISPQLSS
jgi:hypothetical protein